MTVMLETETTDACVYSNYDEVLAIHQTEMFDYLMFTEERCTCFHNADAHNWDNCQVSGCWCHAFWADVRWIYTP